MPHGTVENLSMKANRSIDTHARGLPLAAQVLDYRAIVPTAAGDAVIFRPAETLQYE